MKNVWRVVTRKNFFPLFLVVIFSVLAGRSLLFESGYFNMHDDLQMMRQLQLEKCFLDNQIPCRWVPDMGYGYGFPLFNFYPPLPYLIGEIFRIFSVSFVNTAKYTFFLSILGSGVAMYLLAKEFFGRIGGVLASVFYIWAPYHAVDIYVRGAMNEAWALIFFPLIFWAGYKLIVCEKEHIFRWIITLTLSYFALFTSHNLMVMIFTPFFAVWVLIHLWANKKWGRIPQLLISGIWALGLAAFFTFPAMAENKFTQIKSQLIGYYDYATHFVSIRQLLFSRFWGYGPSVWLEEDRMSFQVGHLHWVISLLMGAVMFARILISKKENFFEKIRNDRIFQVVIFMILFGWASAFMTHLRSVFLYKRFPQIGYIQFPWRFLALVIFAFSFAVGAVPGIVTEWKSNKNKLISILVTPNQIVWSMVLIIFLVVWNWNFFKPEYGKMGALTDEQKFSGRAWSLQQTAGIYDYLPSTANKAPTYPQTTTADVVLGDAEISKAEQGTYWIKFNIDVNSDVASVRINILDFPDWRVFVDNVEVEKYIHDGEQWGRIWVDIPKGEHLVYAQIFNTPVRTYSNIVSLVSWILLLSYPVWRKRFA